MRKIEGPYVLSHVPEELLIPRISVWTVFRDTVFQDVVEVQWDP